MDESGAVHTALDVLDRLDISTELPDKQSIMHVIDDFYAMPHEVNNPCFGKIYFPCTMPSHLRAEVFEECAKRQHHGDIRLFGDWLYLCPPGHRSTDPALKDYFNLKWTLPKCVCKLRRFVSWPEYDDEVPMQILCSSSFVLLQRIRKALSYFRRPNPSAGEDECTVSLEFDNVHETSYVTSELQQLCNNLKAYKGTLYLDLKPLDV